MYSLFVLNDKKSNKNIKTLTQTLLIKTLKKIFRNKIRVWITIKLTKYKDWTNTSLSLNTELSIQNRFCQFSKKYMEWNAEK